MKIYYKNDKFPQITINITNEDDKSNQSYYNFMNFWESLYKKKQFFYFLINIQNIFFPSWGVIFDYMRRENNLKKIKPPYLNFSIVILNNLKIPKFIMNNLKYHSFICDFYLVSEMSVAIVLIKILENQLKLISESNHLIDNLYLNNSI